MNKCKICGEDTEYIYCLKCEYKISRFSPCKNCASRHPCCHTECEPYLLFKEVRIHRRERIHKEKLADYVRIDNMLKGSQEKIMKDKFKRKYSNH